MGYIAENFTMYTLWGGRLGYGVSFSKPHC